MYNSQKSKFLFLCAGILLSPTIILAQNNNHDFIDLSTSIIKRIYDIDISFINDSMISEEIYPDESTDIIFTYENNDTTFQITYDKSSSDFLSLTYKPTGINFEESSVDYVPEKIIEQYTEAQNIYYSIFGENNDFVTCAYQCNINGNNEIIHGNVNFFFEQSNGDALKIIYNIENDIFWNAVVISHYTDYLLELESNSDYREKNNIERIFIELS